jgi:hypothetical protein
VFRFSGPLWAGHAVLLLWGAAYCQTAARIACTAAAAIHAGPLLGVSSAALLRTPLSRWLNVPGSYDGLLLDTKKKCALKRKAADVKVGPLRHARGTHNDGDQVFINVQVRGGGERRGGYNACCCASELRVLQLICEFWRCADGQACWCAC